jgi:hypothetical protein
MLKQEHCSSVEESTTEKRKHCKKFGNPTASAKKNDDKTGVVNQCLFL